MSLDQARDSKGFEAATIMPARTQRFPFVYKPHERWIMIRTRQLEARMRNHRGVNWYQREIKRRFMLLEFYNSAKPTYCKLRFESGGERMLYGTFKSLALAGALALALPAVTNAATISTLYNTGVDDAHTALSGGMDTHYTITAAPGGSTTDNQVLASGWPVAPAGPWVNDSLASRWIGPANVVGNQPNDPPGEYRYTTSFDLTGLNVGSAVIIGRWAADNSGLDIVVNGISTGQTTTSGFENWTSFSLNPADLNQGLNSLVFVILNDAGDSGNPTGLRVEFTTAMASAVPLPAPLLLFATGLGVVGLYSRRKKRKAGLA